jgi:hypothetical protein
MIRFRTGASLAALLCVAGGARADDGSPPDPDAGAAADPDAGVVAADAGGTPTTSRVVAFHFTPTERTQIAIWLEKPDGTFLATVALTQGVSVRGIGNRPGATQMNSGFHWPYGRREGVLPIWAHRRAAAPGAMLFPRIIFQNRDKEGAASRSCNLDSSPDSYYCLSFNQATTGKDNLDAVACASVFNSDKGRIITSADVAAGYGEATEFNGVPSFRVLDLGSLYPPRRDFTSCAMTGTPSPCGGGTSPCDDNPDTLTYVDQARAVMPELDAVTMATPPTDQSQIVMFTIPEGWPEGSYVAWLEVNTEGDYNGTFSDRTYPTPMGTGWDSWAETYGYAYRGQPSVIFSVPFDLLGTSSSFTTAEPVGYGSVDGIEPDSGKMHQMDGSITDDPVNSPGSGADRLRMPPGMTTRLTVEVRDQDFCGTHNPPAMPGGVTAAPVADRMHSNQWAHLHFVVPPSDLAIASYDVRVSTKEIQEANETSFLSGLPAQAATLDSQALMVPTGGATGTPVDVDFGGLSASTTYWVSVRARDGCNRAGPNAVASFATTRASFTQLSANMCFVATAAWGSPLAPEVAALRRARDELRSSSALFAVGSNLYWRSGPAAADLLARSDMARAIARRLIGPLGSIAVAETSR